MVKNIYQISGNQKKGIVINYLKNIFQNKKLLGAEKITM